MKCRLITGCLLAGMLAVSVLFAFDIDRKTVKMRFLEVPTVSVAELDYASLRGELAYGEVTIGEPVLRTTKTICTPKGSKNPIRDAVEVPTHYYEVPFQARAGVVVLRDGAGAVVHTARIDALESSERYGYEQCRYWLEDSLVSDYAEARGSFRAKVDERVRDYFLRRAETRIEQALFFDVIEQKVPVYRYKDKVRDYTDLNEASELARSAYAAMESSVAGLGAAGREDLHRAVVIWEAALAESDVNDKKARINRKVTVKLHESLGVAMLALDDPARAVTHFEKAGRLTSMITSRSDGTGSRDLLALARQRKADATRNAGLPETPAELDRLIETTDAFRGRIPIDRLPGSELARLEAEHTELVTTTVVDAVVAEQAEREEAIAAGRENRYERMVGRTATQGFYLFLMPYPDKLDDFPQELCDLTHLNRLRVPNHEFDEVPQEIGELRALEVLDLSGNQIRSLPDSIGALENLEKLNLKGNRIESLPETVGRLRNLKVLELKGNPLAPGEAERLKRLLPRCKIKV